MQLQSFAEATEWLSRGQRGVEPPWHPAPSSSHVAGVTRAGGRGGGGCGQLIQCKPVAANCSRLLLQRRQGAHLLVQHLKLPAHKGVIVGVDVGGDEAEGVGGGAGVQG